ncbi:MAG: hypothetical protein Q7T41_01680 [Candidatus Saccharibacteria bacterium]|nr:hypothetical protein [Candidatus Saccharibacteria bacterium]
MDSHTAPEQSQRYADNEISSRWGRALFTAVFDGGISGVGALAGFKIAEALSESGSVEAFATAGGALVGLGGAAMLKHIGRH